MDFKKTAGKSFLLPHSCRDIARDVFLGFVDNGLDGIWITRSDPVEVSNSLPSSAKVMWMSSTERSYFNKIDSLSTLKSEIISSLKKKKTVVLIERFDYLMNKYGYSPVINTLYSINDEIRFSESVLLLCINPLSITKDLMMNLEQEFDKFSGPDYSQQFAERCDLKELMDFICENEGTDSKRVCRVLGITRTTLRKRLYTLRDMGFIKILRKGRTNIIQLTGKGNTYKNVSSDRR